MLPPSSSSCRRPQAAQRESKCELLLLLRAAGRKLPRNRGFFFRLGFEPSSSDFEVKIAFIIARKEIM